MDDYVVGERYLHGKTRRPLTLRYVGPLPPTTDSASSASSSDPIWLGIEYDDPAHGKHSGTYKDVQIFSCRQNGAGAFVKASKGALVRGKSFVEALEERYGTILPVEAVASSASDTNKIGSTSDKVNLGTSGIVVDAPGLAAVQTRVGKLERLREVGLEDEWVLGLGGTDAQREGLAERLRNVHTVNLSGNLLSSWQEVARVARHLRGLKTLVLSSSRIAALPADITQNILRELEASFLGVQELHLGNAAIAWDEVLKVSNLFTNLRVLHLHDNATIHDMSDPGGALAKLEMLGLSGTGLTSWSDHIALLASLPSLSTLDISRTAITAIDATTASFKPCTHLTTLIMLSSNISKWADIDSLELWTSGNLSTLRYSMASAREADESDDEQPRPTWDQADPTSISGHFKLDRPLFIAKLSSLAMLNSTPITPAERRDAEKTYLSHVERVSPGNESSWGRYEQLRLKYGGPVAEEQVQPAKRSAALKSKMISVRAILDDAETVIKVLPSAPVVLLRKKIARWADSDAAVRIWTTREVDGVQERVVEIEDGQEAGWWLSDGEVVLVELG